MSKRHGLPWIVVAVALWAFFAPSSLPALFASASAGGVNDLAIWNQWIVAFGLLAVTAALGFAPRAQALGVLVTSVWLIASPWLLGFWASPAPTANAVGEGFLLVMPATLFLVEDARRNQRLSAPVALARTQITMTWARGRAAMKRQLAHRRRSAANKIDWTTRTGGLRK